MPDDLITDYLARRLLRNINRRRNASGIFLTHGAGLLIADRAKPALDTLSPLCILHPSQREAGTPANNAIGFD